VCKKCKISFSSPCPGEKGVAIFTNPGRFSSSLLSWEGLESGKNQKRGIPRAYLALLFWEGWNIYKRYGYYLFYLNWYGVPNKNQAFLK